VGDTQQDTAEVAGPEAEAVEVDTDTEIARLAKLRMIDYERERKVAAVRLGITRISVLDKLVGAERKEGGTVGQGKPLELPEPEPWPDPVDGAGLLSAIADVVNDYVIVTPEEANVVALWCLHTFAFLLFYCTPRLAITSPVKQCGKTTLLDVIERLVCRPLSTGSITAPSVFRAIEIARPTLLIDEADTFLGQNDELRGVLNSGHRRGGQVLRTVGDHHEPRVFSTHSPCAIAMIGQLPDTLADRSISIRLRRRLPDEKIKSFRIDRVSRLTDLARQAARWVIDHTDKIGESEPELPAGLYNRQADNWRPLFALAAVAGRQWPERAKSAAIILTGAIEDDSLSTQLLADIRDIFAEKGFAEDDNGMRSAELVAMLVALPERPWGEWNHGKAITQNGLARRLRPFGIRPGDVHAGDGEARRSFKGYAAKSIKEACERYIFQNTPLPSAPPRHSKGNKDLVDNQTAPQKNGGADGNEANSMKSNDLRGGADENPQTGDACECADDLPPAEAGNSTNGGADENEVAPEQSDRLAAARRLVERAQDLGIPLLVKNGELMRESGWADESLLSEIREHKAEIIAGLQGGWGAR
jgi:putative DNA primase/helicase